MAVIPDVLRSLLMLRARSDVREVVIMTLVVSLVVVVSVVVVLVDVVVVTEVVLVVTDVVVVEVDDVVVVIAVVVGGTVQNIMYSFSNSTHKKVLLYSHPIFKETLCV